jgi:hypothetical protein
MRIIPLVLLVAGCSTHITTDPYDGGQDLALTAVCAGALADYCKGACPTYDETWAEAHSQPRCFYLRNGTCGNLRFIEYSSAGSNDVVRYFDDAGRLVAAHAFDDTMIYCGNAFDERFGPVPDCTLVEREVVCACTNGVRTGGYCPRD